MSFWCLSILPKDERKQFDSRYHSSKVELFCFLEELKIQKCSFEINRPLPEDWQKYCITRDIVFLCKYHTLFNILLHNPGSFSLVGLPLSTIKEIIENFPSWSYWLFYRVFISLFSFHHWRQNTKIERCSE